jgi:hypothetical protein
MPTAAQFRASELYANLLEELKLRIAAIDAGTSGQLAVLPPPIVREHCYLQIRFACEIVALGCLLAHGDIVPKSSKLLGKWAANEIMDGIERLHPDFYPRPARFVNDGAELRVDWIEPNPLPKGDLLKIYGQCGDILHKGKIKKIISPTDPIVIHYPDITKIARKFVDALTNHVVFMLGGQTMFLAILQNVNDNLRVQVAIAESPLARQQLQQRGGGVILAR